MSRLLTEELRNALPPLRNQENTRDPMVYAIFYFRGSGWRWFATEGELRGDDFIFFGYVIGFEREYGYFSLKELEEVNVNGIVIERYCDFEPSKLSRCLYDLGLR